MLATMAVASAGTVPMPVTASVRGVPAATLAFHPPVGVRLSRARVGIMGWNTEPDHGVTGADAADGSLPPAALVATTVNVWATPAVRPYTTHDSGPHVRVQVAPPGDAVTV